MAASPVRQFLCVGFLILSLAFPWGVEVQAAPQFDNISALSKELNFDPYYTLYRRVKRKARIAVFDDGGFIDYEKEVGKTLPKDLVYHDGPSRYSQQTDDHGLRMAQLVWALMTKNGQFDQFEPEMHLFNTQGFTNFKAALDAIADGNFDLVLNSQVRSYGGNGDGRGYLNKMVSRAIEKSIRQKDKPVIWFNAAGNYREHTYTTQIKLDQDGWVETGRPNNEVRIRCTKPTDKRDKREGCDIKLILSWGQYSDDPDEQGTDQDLDLLLTDDTLKIVQITGGDKVQQINPAKGNPKHSALPREEAIAHVEPGQYFVRIKARSQNFSDDEEMALYVQGDGVELLDKSIESSLKILPPADNPDVITVGAFDSERSNQSFRERKPDLTSTSLVKLADGRVFMGSSNATAFMVAAAGILLSFDPSLEREQVENLLAPGFADSRRADTVDGEPGEGEEQKEQQGQQESNNKAAENPSRSTYGRLVQSGRMVGFAGPPPAFPGVPGPQIMMPPGSPLPERPWGQLLQSYSRERDSGSRSRNKRDSEGKELTVERALELGCRVFMEANNLVVDCPFALPQDLTERVRMSPPFSRKGVGIAKLPDPLKVIELRNRD